MKKVFWVIVGIALLIAFDNRPGSDAQSRAFIGKSAHAITIVLPAVIGGALAIVSAASTGFSGGTTSTPQAPAPKPAPKPATNPA